MKSYFTLTKIIFGLSFLFMPFMGFSVTFIVDNAGDADDGLVYTAANGTNTLRKCMRLANANANSPTIDIINFTTIPGVGPYILVCATMLPVITDPVTINAFTAPGYVAPTPRVIIKGSGAVAAPSPIANGFNITAGGSNSSIYGFTIYRTTAEGIYANGATNLTIQGCWVGLTETGVLPGSANSRVGTHGITLVAGSNNCSIGIATAAGQNVISGNREHGILIINSTNTTIMNNYIGTNTTGTAAIANSINGINIDNNCTSVIIGGAAANQGNLISGNTGSGILIANASSNPVIKGNKIGTNLTGNAAIGNGDVGLNIFTNVLNPVIGGSLAGEGNLISGNGSHGVNIDIASHGAVIRGNLIGTNAAGLASIPNAYHGINILASDNNTIGGNTKLQRNIISGNGILTAPVDYPKNGISINTSNGNIIQGNFIGLGVNGNTAVPNYSTGLSMSNSAGNTIGGANYMQRNVLSGNNGFGGYLFNVDNTPITQNYFGVDSTGTLDRGNGANGILATDDCNLLIWTLNIASGNGADGLSINASTANTLQTNIMGLAIDGTTIIPNVGSGLSISNSSGIIIGGTNILERNIISGNTGFGFYMSNVDNSSVTQNYFGTDYTGALDRGNGSHGISANSGCDLVTWTNNIVSGNGGNGADLLTVTNNTIYGNYFGLSINGTTPIANATIGLRLGLTSTDNTIGGVAVGQRNYFSGNGNHGMMLDVFSSGNTIKGNYIGSDITGLIAVPNQTVGLLLLEEANNNIIGGTAANEGNLFCCSATSPGIQINISNGNTIQGNLIGTNINGVIATGFGNAEDGILMGSYWNFGSTANSNIIGGLAPGARNIITNNGRDGVHLAVWGGSNGTNFNPIIGNTIYCNGGLGINMEANLANENEGVAAPVVTSSTANTVSGTGVTGNTIHVYRNVSTDGARCDCEGEIYVGTTTVAGGTWTLPHGLGLSAADALSVTATQTNPTNSTSEFWVCSVPLPMELLSIKAEKASNHITVSFDVSNENNIQNYYILRSNDGVNFEMIGSVIPLNLEYAHSYSFIDENPFDGTNYYRIQTVENDGRVAHSKIVQATMNSITAQVYPNPATDMVTITAGSTSAKVELINNLGQVVLVKTLEGNSQTISVSMLAEGFYIVKISEGESSSVYKLEKR